MNSHVKTLPIGKNLPAGSNGQVLNGSGQWVTVPSGQVTISVPTPPPPQGFSFQITANGAGIFPTPVAPTPPISQTDIKKQNEDAFDRAMRGIG